MNLVSFWIRATLWDFMSIIHQYFQCFDYYKAIEDWNSLPADVKIVKNIYEFVNKVKTSLTDNMKLKENADFIFY